MAFRIIPNPSADPTLYPENIQNNRKSNETSFHAPTPIAPPQLLPHLGRFIHDAHTEKKP